MKAQSSLDTTDFQRILKRNVTLPLLVGMSSVVTFVGFIFFFLSTMSWVAHTQTVIGKANELMVSTVDMESGVRGFALTGRDSFLAPYQIARPVVRGEIQALLGMVGDNPLQMDRLRRIQVLTQQWDEYAQTLIQARRSDTDLGAIVGSEVGKQLFDRIRTEFSSFKNTEAFLLMERTAEAHSVTWQGAGLYVLFIVLVNGWIAWAGRRDIVKLSRDFGTALQAQVDAAVALQEQAWLRDGQTQLAEGLIGQQTLGVVGRSVLEFTAQTLGQVVGAIYVRDEGGTLQRIAAYGFEARKDEDEPDFEQGLVGQTLHDGLIHHVQNLDVSYFKVSSGLGRDKPAELVLAPVHHDGFVNGVIELGFMKTLNKRELALLKLVAGSIGASIDAAQYRKRLQSAVEETQQLNEELQVQQEELRTANEELSEQSRVLAQSQTHLEHQQAELEQTNTQLAEQAYMLDRKNEALNEAQHTLQQRADDLQRASRYKSEFLANMSHELRTPLNSSLILAKLLSENRDGNLNPEQLKFAQTIYSAGNDLLNLINDILDLSKVEAGRLELQPQFVAVHKMLETVQRMFAPLAQQKKLAFEVKMEPGTPASVVTDNLRVEQILKNLLSNALKFTESGGVTLTVAPTVEEGVAFIVKDTGIGIPEGQKDVIFEAFRQADGTINRRYGGTGLGLSISRELARLLGGSIEVESLSGQGSTFKLSLPSKWVELEAAGEEADKLLQLPGAAALTSASSHSAPPSALFAQLSAAFASLDVNAPLAQSVPTKLPATPPFADDRHQLDTGGRVLLVVEDDSVFASVLYELAHEMRYCCLVAQSAAEGIELATAFLPQAILLDVRLPDGSGLSVLQVLKDDPRTRHIPVHVISSEDHSEVAMHMGAVGVAVKPTTREELNQIFQRLEEKNAKKVKRVLVVEDDARQRDSVVHLIEDEDIEIAAVENGVQALTLLRETVFDCMIIDLKLPDMDGSELLERMTMEDIFSFPPVIVYTGRNLTREEEGKLNRYSRSIIIKGARSPERLLDEVTLFLHTVESQLSAERQTMLRAARNREKVFEGRKVLLVDDDVRNIFALASALEHKGLVVEVGRNGFEALEKLAQDADIDLVLMDVMMPGMDGLEATRRIRANPRFAQVPVIAITAKAMKDDQEQCRRAGANDYLAKPIDLDQLFSLMRVWMPSIERA